MRTMIVVGALFASASSYAVDASKAKLIVGKSDCMTCHAVNNKIVGPGFNEVAAKYKGDKGAVDSLAKKIKSGGSGVWGAIPMPAHPNLSDADVKLLAQWILEGAK
ncbi:cytochrome C [Herbaspirillum sp. meg3]|nr:c-type cytochrome [Herbaspirillum sp. meg3]ASU41201.1 cytochrome C [Herbaspirillum sp. meg3]